MRGFFLWIKNISRDLNTISWIGRKELFSLLVVVCIAVFVCSLMILGVDYVFHSIINFLINL